MKQLQKIIFVCSEYPPSRHGGIGVFIKNLSEELVKRNIQVHVIGFDENKDVDLFEKVNGVDVYRLYNPWPSTKMMRLGKYHISAAPYLKRKLLSKKLNELIEKENPDLVESYDWSGPLWNKPRVKTIVRLHGSKSVHDYVQNKRKSILNYWFEKRNLKFADYYISISNFINYASEKAFNLKLHSTVIANSSKINLSTIISNKKKLNQILFVGRIHPVKGLEKLLKAMGLVWNERPEVELLIVGQGNKEYSEYIKSIVPGQYLPKVTFMGFIKYEDLPDIYSESALMLMPSESEAFGLTAIESIMCGTYVIGNAKGSLPEILTNKKLGKTINFDNVKEASGAIISFLDHPIFPIPDKEFNEKYSNEFVVDKNIEFYNLCLN